MKLRTFSLAALLALSLLAPSGKSWAEAVKIRLAYGILPAVISPLLFQRPDILKHYGKTYTVDAVYIRATSIALQAMAAGEIDVSYMSFTALANAIINGNLDMKVISDVAGWGSKGHQGPEMVVLADSPIKSAADLKGKVLAVTAKGTGFHYALLANLRKAGLKENTDFTVVEVRIPAMDAALREGRVHLITTVPPFLYISEKKGGVRRLFRPEDAMGDVQSLVNVGRTDFLRKNSAAMVDFMEDYLIALKWFLDPKNHDQAVAIAAKFAKRKPNTLGYAFTKKDFYRAPDATPDIKTLQQNINLMQELGVIKQKVDVKPYVDLSYLNEAKKRLGM